MAEAAELLTYARDRELLDLLDSPMTTVHLIRHAKAKNRLDVGGARPSSPADEARQAGGEAIAARLADEPPTRLVSSPFVRCVQTLEPLAVALDLPIETTDLLAEGADGERAAELMLSLAVGGPVACCTHGDVLFEVVDRRRAFGRRARRAARRARRERCGLSRSRTVASPDALFVDQPPR